MAESIAVYAGTFDPITNGHLDIIERALKIFDKLVVAITDNPSKKPFFSTEERVEMVKESVKHLKNIEVESFKGLLVGYVKKKGSNIIIRGLRAISDFEYELEMASMNRKLKKEIETVFIMTNEKFSFISSSLAKEIARMKGDISCTVPAVVEKKLKGRF